MSLNAPDSGDNLTVDGRSEDGRPAVLTLVCVIAGLLLILAVIQIGARWDAFQQLSEVRALAATVAIGILGTVLVGYSTSCRKSLKHK